MKSPHMYPLEGQGLRGFHVNDMTQSVKNGLKRALAVVLFTLLLVGAAAAVLSAFAAGVTALSNVHVGFALSGVSAPSVTTMGPTTSSSQQGGTTYGNTAQGQTGTTTSTLQGTVGPGSTGQRTTNPPLNSGQQGGQSDTSVQNQAVVTGPSAVDRVNQELSQMQSPVMQNLDAGGVSLGDKVQNAFGQFLGGLLQTLFVEQPNQGNSAGTPSQSGGQ